jgi:hypothetical protein
MVINRPNRIIAETIAIGAKLVLQELPSGIKSEGTGDGFGVTEEAAGFLMTWKELR